MPEDNSTFRQKRRLRLEGLRILRDRGITPVILETHGGWGALYKTCYQPFLYGVVCDKDGEKTSELSHHRPTWHVYECDVNNALAGGLHKDTSFTFLDFDPYGDAWPTINAFFDNHRVFADTMVVAVNDGLRQKLSIGAADVKTMKQAVLRYGNKIRDQYLPICRELFEEKMTRIGFEVEKFSGYYTGHGKNMTHWLAVISRV